MYDIFVSHMCQASQNYAYDTYDIKYDISQFGPPSGPKQSQPDHPMLVKNALRNSFPFSAKLKVHFYPSKWPQLKKE